MNDLEQQLREMDPAGPPLGFDPDEVAAKAKRARGRRAIGAAGLATATVALGAAVLVTSSSPAYLSAAGPGTSGKPSPSSVSLLPVWPSTVVPGSSAPPAAAPSTALSGDRLQQTRARLLNALEKAMPGVSKVTIDASGDEHGLTAVVHYTDPAGHPGQFNISVADKASFAQPLPLSLMCQSDPLFGPDGKPRRCDKIPQPDGSVLVVSDSVSVSLPVGNTFNRVSGLNGILFREDGTSVSVFAYDIPTSPGQPGATWLTDQQLTKLITDPALTLS